MNRKLALKILNEIMFWNDDTKASEEFRWLTLMSSLKYDGYQGFHAGIRFTESLVNWLQQFDPTDRAAAYEFVRRKLIYVGAPEFQRLVENFYPEIIQPYLVETVARTLSIPDYSVWTIPEAEKEFMKLRRKILFLGLSDGARLDEFRRANVGRISNEQVAVTTQLEAAKWEDLLKELRKEGLESDGKSRFSTIVLVDDFVGSGTSLIRLDREAGKRVWKGKLHKFFTALTKAEEAIGEPIVEDGWRLIVYHYLATHQAARASKNVEKRYRTAINTEKKGVWHDRVGFQYGHVLPEDMPIASHSDAPFNQLVNSDQYYDPAIETDHNVAGGSRDIRNGYGDCALPLVLEHNTPNNTVPLLWAESQDSGSNSRHMMRPLFLRKQRHS